MNVFAIIEVDFRIEISFKVNVTFLYNMGDPMTQRQLPQGQLSQLANRPVWSNIPVGPNGITITNPNKIIKKTEPWGGHPQVGIGQDGLRQALVSLDRSVRGRMHVHSIQFGLRVPLLNQSQVRLNKLGPATLVAVVKIP